MSSASFDRVRKLVLECWDLAPEARTARLAEVAKGDPALAQAARVLLAHDSADLAPSLDDPRAAHAVSRGPGRVGRYAISRPLGAGGMGIVHVGLDESLGREVAIKVLPEWLASHEPALERFREEARLLARVSHPHIATIYSLENAGDDLLLTMELVRGSSLSERLREGPCTIEESLGIGRQLASALEAAHAEGIVHRDLKPSNIMLSEHHGVKVLDFGVAKLVESRVAEADSDVAGAAPVSNAVRLTGAMGTPGYMSPEQINGEDVDLRADVWALGCVLYECLTGRRLFGGSPADRLRSTIHDAPDLDRLPADTPAPLRELIGRCVEKSLDARLAAASDARCVIEEVIELREVQRLQARLAGRARGDAEATLPFQLTQFLGRAPELEELGALLTTARLVTVTGLGGTGKTRLVVELLRGGLGSSGRIVFVELAPLRSGDELMDALSSASGVNERGARDGMEMLVDHFAASDACLVIDNCEHLLEPAAGVVRTLLSRCPSLRVLATSREALGIDGERVFPLSPFPVPPEEVVSSEQLMENDAVALFTDRATLADAAFALTPRNARVVSRLCRRLEGLPLSLELAAALLDVLSPEEILALADEHLAALQRPGADANARHQSIATMLDWSHERLSDAERQVFRCLSVFRGGFTLAGAEAVAGPGGEARWRMLDVVAALVRKSLVVREPAPDGAGSRYAMLQTVREYAATQLAAAGEASAVADRHLAYCADFAESIRLIGPEQALWTMRAAAEEENVRAALDHARTSRALAEQGARAALGMTGYWRQVGRWRRSRRRSVEAADELAASDRRESFVYVRLRRAAGDVAGMQGDLEGARTYLTEASELAGRLDEPRLVISCLNTLGNIEKNAGDLDRARVLFDQAIELRRAHPNPWDLSGMLFNRGVVFAMQGNYEEAERDFEGSLTIKRELADDRGISHALNALGFLASGRGRFEEARRLLEESMTIKRALSDTPGVVNTLLNLGHSASDQFETLDADAARLEDARGFYEEALELAREIGDRPNESRARLGLGFAVLLAGSEEEATRIFEEALEIAREVGNLILNAWSVMGFATVAAFRDEHERAAALASESLRMFADSKVDAMPEVIDVLAWASLGRSRASEAATFLGAAAQQRAEKGAGLAAWRRLRNDRACDHAAHELGRVAFDEVYAEGGPLSLGALVELARRSVGADDGVPGI